MSIRCLANILQEKGAFKALKEGHLQALQVYVHPDDQHRERVLESYTFTIKYDQRGGDERTVTGLELDGPDSSLVSVQASNSALQGFLRQIMGLCSGLPELPGSCRYAYNFYRPC